MHSWDEINEFLNQRENLFCNKWNVLFNSVQPGYMFVECRWPGYKGEFDLYIVFLCNDVEVFFEKLQVGDANSLENVTPQILQQLFYSSDANVYCSLNDDDCLTYEICQGRLIACYEEANLLHEVKAPLQTSEDFIGYTQQYFEAIKSTIRMNKSDQAILLN